MDHRKTTRSTRATAKLKSSLVSPDELADQLASTLHISKAKDKTPVFDVEKRRRAAMRSVNLASQSITAHVQSGWKLKTAAGASTSKMASTERSVNASATSISKYLQELREICPGDVDVERAAVSVVGKLIAVEMVRDPIVSRTLFN
jgi:separase